MKISVKENEFKEKLPFMTLALFLTAIFVWIAALYVGNQPLIRGTSIFLGIALVLGALGYMMKKSSGSAAEAAEATQTEPEEYTGGFPLFRAAGNLAGLAAAPFVWGWGKIKRAPKEPCTLTVKVLDLENSPVSAAQIRLQPGWLYDGQKSVTDENGVAKFRLHKGKWKIKVAKAGYQYAHPKGGRRWVSESVQCKEEENEHTTYLKKIAGSGQVSIVIKDTEGNTVDGEVEFNSGWLRGGERKPTTDGKVTFDGVKGKKYPVRVRKTGYDQVDMNAKKQKYTYVNATGEETPVFLRKTAAVGEPPAEGTNEEKSGIALLKGMSDQFFYTAQEYKTHEWDPRARLHYVAGMFGGEKQLYRHLVISPYTFPITKYGLSGDTKTACFAFLDKLSKTKKLTGESRGGFTRIGEWVGQWNQVGVTGWVGNQLKQYFGWVEDKIFKAVLRYHAKPDTLPRSYTDPWRILKYLDIRLREIPTHTEPSSAALNEATAEAIRKIKEATEMLPDPKDERAEGAAPLKDSPEEGDEITFLTDGAQAAYDSVETFNKKISSGNPPWDFQGALNGVHAGIILIKPLGLSGTTLTPITELFETFYNVIKKSADYSGRPEQAIIHDIIEELHKLTIHAAPEGPKLISAEQYAVRVYNIAKSRLSEPETEGERLLKAYRGETPEGALADLQQDFQQAFDKLQTGNYMESLNALEDIGNTIQRLKASPMFPASNQLRLAQNRFDEIYKELKKSSSPLLNPNIHLTRDDLGDLMASMIKRNEDTSGHTKHIASLNATEAQKFLLLLQNEATTQTRHPGAESGVPHSAGAITGEITGIEGEISTYINSYETALNSAQPLLTDHQKANKKFLDIKMEFVTRRPFDEKISQTLRRLRALAKAERDLIEHLQNYAKPALLHIDARLANPTFGNNALFKQATDRILHVLINKAKQ